MNGLKYFGFANFSFTLNKPEWVIIEEYYSGIKKCYNLDGSLYGNLTKNQIKYITGENDNV